LSACEPGAKLIGAQSSLERAEVLRVGVGRRAITPPLGTPCSLGLDDECEQIFDTPHVRALSLANGSGAVCLVAADVIGLQQRTIAELRAAVAERTGLPKEAIIAHGTHTHQAPAVHIANNVPLAPYGLHFADPHYYRFFLEQTALAAQDAVRSASPARAWVGAGRVEGVASNRRFVDAAGALHWRSSRPAAALRELPEGEIDPFVRVLRFQREAEPQEVLVLNYCCHPTASGGDEERYVTADFPGEAMRLLEEARPGRWCMYFTGPCGDINPGKHVGDGQEPEDRIRDVRLLGQRLAQGVQETLRGMRPAEAALRLARREVQLPLRADLPTAAELEERLAAAVAEYRAAKAAGRRLPGGGPVRRLVHLLQLRAVASGDVIRVEVVALGLAQGVAMAFLPGECFLALSRELARGFQGMLFPVAPTDYSAGYIPTPEAYDQGGYEPQVAVVAPEAFGVLLAAASDLLAAL